METPHQHDVLEIPAPSTCPAGMEWSCEEGRGRVRGLLCVAADHINHWIPSLKDHSPLER